MSNHNLIKELINLDGTNSLVTGGHGHLGSAITETLAELGSNIIMLGQNKEKGDEFVKKLKNNFEINAEFFKVDINSKAEINNFFLDNDELYDILVNNAFSWPNNLRFEDIEWEDFENTIRSGITSPFYFTKKVVDAMKEREKGSIINIGSMYGMISPNFKIYQNQPKMGNAISYNASKAAIIQMTKYMAVYFAPWNIRVNCISPGPFPRPGTFDNGKEWFEKELKKMNPLKKLGEPWHLKGAVALLASDLGAYMTGQNISVDGGWTIW